MTPLLEVHALEKTFRTGPPWRRDRLVALASVELELEPGGVLALFGANGAGKTTLLKILASLLAPDAGTIRILGRTHDGGPAIRRLVGFASGDDRSLFFRLTGRQNLDFFGALHGLRAAERARRIAELARELDLADVLDRRVDRCSSGMRTRIGLARALLHRPSLLLLDEPTKSLDAEHAAQAHAAVRGAVARGAGIVFATHSPAELASLATAAATLEQGRLVGTARAALA